MPRLRFFVALGLLFATIVLSLGHLALGSVHRRVAAAAARAATTELARRDLVGDGRRLDPSCGTMERPIEGWTCLRSPERPSAALRRLRTVLPGSAVSCIAAATPGHRPLACMYEAEVAGGLVVVNAFPHLVVSTARLLSGDPAVDRMPHPVGTDIVLSVVDQSAG